MIKIFNVLFTIFRLILIVAATCLTAYIIMGMYDRLGKDLTEAINVFIPFVLLFFLFLLNLAYFGTMSGMIIYNVICSNFLTYSDLINITYIGSFASVTFGMILTAKH